MVIESCVGCLNVYCFASLGQQRYLSCLRLVDGVVGNSSSGLAEAPSLGVGTVNIGDRQRGRLKADSVIDCAPEREAIAAAIATLRSPGFRRRIEGTASPYGEPGAARKIVAELERHPLAGLLKKSFHDLAAAAGTLQ